MKPTVVSGPALDASSRTASNIVAIILALLLPPIGIFFARSAIDSAKEVGADDTIPHYALWISVAFTAAGLLVFIFGFTTSVIIPTLSMR